MSKKEEHELRSLLREFIVESDTGMPGYGADVGPLMGNGYGFMNYGGSLKNIFVDPFTDVFKTAKGVATQLTTRAKHAAQIAIETVLSSVIPLYQTNYSNIFRNMGKSLEEVKKKYAKVYQANDEAFRDKDARFLAFLYDPSAWITAKTAGAAPAKVASVLEIFTDGTAGSLSHLQEAIRYLRELQYELQGTSRYNRTVPHRLRRQAHTHRNLLPWEGKENLSEPILEAENQVPQGQVPAAQTPEQKIAAILSNPELKKEIDSSPTAQAMKADAQQLLGQLTNQLSKDIASAASVGSFADIQKMTGGRVKIPNIEGTSPQDRQRAEEAAVTSVRQGLSEFYRRSLTGAIQEVQKQGVPPNNAYLRTLNALLQKVPSA